MGQIAMPLLSTRATRKLAALASRLECTPEDAVAYMLGQHVADVKQGEIGGDWARNEFRRVTGRWPEERA